MKRAVREFKICLCGCGSQLSALKWECAKCMQHSTQESRWISQLNLPVIKLYRHTEVYTLITILLKNAGVILDSYKVEDGVENKFVS